MKLDRNINTDGRGKYALIKMREATIADLGDAFAVTKSAVDFGGTPETDFFVIRLKDKYAAAALAAYAGAAMRDDPEYALEVLSLAKAAAESPCQKQPD